MRTCSSSDSEDVNFTEYALEARMLQFPYTRLAWSGGDGGYMTYAVEGGCKLAYKQKHTHNTVMCATQCTDVTKWFVFSFYVNG